MYPSTNTNNLGNTNTTNTTPLSDNNLPNDNNNNNNNSVDSTTYPNSSSSSFHPIHSPYIYYEEDPSFLQQLHDYFLQQQQQQPIVAQQTAVTSMEKHTDEHVPISNGLHVKGSHAFCNNTSNQIPRKRSSKKDRHSKINTAHGPRDRRMRLSLDVAQKFFGLQDMLGFDKASKTVQWLLTKSKTAIKQLTNSTNVSNTTSASSTSNNSECEVLSGIIDDSSLSLPRETDKAKAAREKKAVTTKGARVSRAFHQRAKETREKARARARERTVEKRIRLGNGTSNYYEAKKIPCIDQTLNRHLGSWSPFEARVEEESSSRIRIVNDHPHPSSFLQADHPVYPMQHKQDTSVSGWSTPSPLFNYQNPFAEFQCFGKPWDHAYNN